MHESGFYTYDDWWKGEICLIYSTVVRKVTIKDEQIQVNIKDKDNNDKIVTVNTKQIESNENPVQVSWDEICIVDIPKIKEKQKIFFNKKVNQLLEVWKKYFLDIYQTSETPNILLDRELKQCADIMSGPMPLTKLWTTNHRLVTFKTASLIEIRKFITQTKINGVKPEFDFIHSPSYSYKSNDIPVEVYAQSLWEYSQWLETLSPLEKNNDNKENDSNPNHKPPKVKMPENPYGKIFKNGYAYNLFLDLKKDLVTEKTRRADFSFIFHRMTIKDLINENVTQLAFIKFLRVNNIANIKGRKLPFNTSHLKEQLFVRFLAKYKDFI